MCVKRLTLMIEMLRRMGDSNFLRVAWSNQNGWQRSVKVAEGGVGRTPPRHRCTLCGPVPGATLHQGDPGYYGLTLG
jgi:hypothetical protein